MSEKIEAALSEHEWRMMRRERGGEVMQAYLSYDGRQVVLPCDGDATGATTPAERHALAALCLYGQPFGFTWADVDALRDSWVPEQDRDDRADEAHMAKLANLADRIEALLPPRETP